MGPVCSIAHTTLCPLVPTPRSSTPFVPCTLNDGSFNTYEGASAGLPVVWPTSGTLVAMVTAGAGVDGPLSGVAMVTEARTSSITHSGVFSVTTVRAAA